MSIAIALASFMLGGLFGMAIMCFLQVNERSEKNGKSKKNK